MTEKTRRRLASLALLVGIFLLWEVACVAWHVSDLVLPRPSQILVTLYQRFPVLLPHIAQTLGTTLAGFALGVAAGILLGVLVGVSPVAYDTVYPLMVGFSSIPKVALVPLFVLWFGAGTLPAVLTAMSLAVFPVLVNVATGLATTEPEWIDVLRVLHATRRDILFNISLPRALPYLFASLKVAIALAFVGSVISETVASNRGIGDVMMLAASNFDVRLVFAGLFVLAGLGIALYALFAWAERRLTGWTTRGNDIAFV